ncbi:MAG: aquaporin [Stellaceae bacterium]
MPLSKKLAAEFIGTFWLVFGGCGSAVIAAKFPEIGIGLVGVALAFGLTVLTMAYAVGHISGGHFNPAVTGDVQVMSAGSGIRHAEYNHESAPTRIFQIWIVPTTRGGPPSWGTRPFPQADRAGRLVVLASGDRSDAEALPIRTDARVLGARLQAGEKIEYRLRPGRHAYLVPAMGALTVNDIPIEKGDGAAIRDEAVLRLCALDDTEIVLVDCA